jgi:predicted short-subunit dehydrogenase-like oxidoreductase (DUF2520 family)
VAGRGPQTASVTAVARRFGAEPVELAAVGRGASLVVLAPPDAAIEAVAAVVADGLEGEALVIHLSGARGLDALAPIATRRADVALGALHPLQTLPEDAGVGALAGGWAAIAGVGTAVERVAELAVALGMQPFTVPDEHRGTYHAAAVVASNHLIALLGQVERLVAVTGVPLAAFRPLVEASVANAFRSGPRAALTGPVARGDVDTVRRHLDAIPLDERPAYRALADAARRLAGREDAALVEALS